MRDLDGDGLADIIRYNTLEDTIDVYGFREIQSLHFAQIGNGGGFTSEIVLTNPSPTLTSSGTISFFDDLGQPLPIALSAEEVGAKLLTSWPAGENGTVDFELEPLGSLTLVTDGQGPVVAGSARVDSDQVLGGVIRFQLSGVGASGDLSGLVAPVRRDGTVNTGLALHNPGDQPVNLRLSLRDAQGQPVPNGQRRIDDLPALGHLARFIGGPGEVLFPDADTENFTGTLLVEVEKGRVVAMALELGQLPGTFTTLPVTPHR